MAHGGVLGEAVPRPETHLQPPVAQLVERRHLLGQRHRVMQVVVEDQRAETDPLRGDRCRGEADQRGRLGPDVVADLEDVEAGILGGARRADDLLRRRRGGLEPEAEGPHPADDTERRRGHGRSAGLAIAGGAVHSGVRPGPG